MEWAIPAFAFSAEAGTQLPTPEGWKAELALGGYSVERGICPIAKSTITELFQ